MVVELTKLEADGGYQPDQQVVSDVRDYAAETHNGFDHVLRWMRVLKTFGACFGYDISRGAGIRRPVPCGTLGPCGGGADEAGSSGL